MPGKMLLDKECPLTCVKKGFEKECRIIKDVW
jgi:hypothetical protein